MAIRNDTERTARGSPAGRRDAFPDRTRPTPTTSGRPSQSELDRLLNEDFARECQGVYAYAVFAERFRDDNPEASAECEARGRREVAHAMTLCQLVYDSGAAVTAVVDDRAAVRRAGRVAHPAWLEQTVRRLRSRAEQLRAAGRPNLAYRLLVLVDQKQASADLADIVRRHTPSQS